MVKKRISGTREWAVANIDCCTGCSHGCRYCYARYSAVVKEKRVDPADWSNLSIRKEDVEKDYGLYPGQVMFPTTHDIVEENLSACLTVLQKLLVAGNQVLIVSKPSLACTTLICERLGEFKERMLFRFTITARDRDLLRYWEPAAPDYSERKNALCHVYEQGFNTSVSVEPMLDTADVVDMVHDLLPFINHSIWLGKLNKIDRRVEVVDDCDRMQVEKIIEGQKDQKIKGIYQQLKDTPLIRWKESVKKVIGLPLADEPGMDI